MYFYPIILVNTKTRVGAWLQIYTSTLRVSVFIHHYSLPLWEIVLIIHGVFLNSHIIKLIFPSLTHTAQFKTPTGRRQPVCYLQSWFDSGITALSIRCLVCQWTDVFIESELSYSFEHKKNSWLFSRPFFHSACYTVLTNPKRTKQLSAIAAAGLIRAPTHIGSLTIEFKVSTSAILINYSLLMFILIPWLLDLVRSCRRDAAFYLGIISTELRSQNTVLVLVKFTRNDKLII